MTAAETQMTRERRQPSPALTTMEEYTKSMLNILEDFSQRRSGSRRRRKRFSMSSRTLRKKRRSSRARSAPS